MVTVVPGLQIVVAMIVHFQSVVIATNMATVVFSILIAAVKNVKTTFVADVSSGRTAVVR